MQSEFYGWNVEIFPNENFNSEFFYSLFTFMTITTAQDRKSGAKRG